MKTTAPKRYCVRPNNGIVDGRSTATIHVMLQPFDGDASQNSERFKHKFMVQTCFAPDGDVDLDSVVSHFPSVCSMHQHYSCSKCHFSRLTFFFPSLMHTVEECKSGSNNRFKATLRFRSHQSTRTCGRICTFDFD